ncbi:MAG: prepilin-type N-terminal cleavage/methylation domain-containing protein [Acidobacteria bacterium]|nr:prepilin-type N-terminal cleavage/methylation domain-containing protein [Acidobacteriota bacterium]
MPKKSGFSLTELLMVVLILTIMLAVGVPYMADAMAESRLEGFTQQLNLALQRARYIASYENARTCLQVENSSTTTALHIWRDEVWNSTYDSANAVERASRMNFPVPEDVTIHDIKFGVRDGLSRVLVFEPDGRLAQPDSPTSDLVQDPLDSVYRCYIKFSTNNFIKKTMGREIYISRTGEMRVLSYEQ